MTIEDKTTGGNTYNDAVSFSQPGSYSLYGSSTSFSANQVLTQTSEDSFDFTLRNTTAFTSFTMVYTSSTGGSVQYISLQNLVFCT